MSNFICIEVTGTYLLKPSQKKELYYQRQGNKETKGGEEMKEKRNIWLYDM